MTDAAIIEAAARALGAHEDNLAWEDYDEGSLDDLREVATLVLAAVTPMIEAAALERAAKMVEEWLPHQGMQQQWERWTKDQIAAAIRALKEKVSA